MIRCAFYIRVQVSDDPTYRYDRVTLAGPHGGGYLHTEHPPLVGDLIHLWDAVDKRGGQFRVIERTWMHSSYGSVDWPYGKPVSQAGSILDVVVEAADGPFRNEAELPDEDEEL